MDVPLLRRRGSGSWRLLAGLMSVALAGLTGLPIVPPSAEATDQQQTTIFIGKHYEVRPDGTTVKYVYVGDQLLAAIFHPPSGKEHIQYVHPDHLGSVHLVTDEAGQVIARTEYAPYGTTSQQDGAADLSHQFTGQRFDHSTGLHFYNGRYYDSQLGRFIQPDPFVQDPSDPQLLNRYTYARNNPLKYTDPSGYFVILAFLAAIAIGTAIGAVTSVAIGAVTGQIHSWKDVGRLAAVGGASGAFLSGGGYLLGPGALALAGTAKTLAEIGLSVTSGMIGGGLDSHMQGGSFSGGLVPGAASGLVGYGLARGIGAAIRISTEPSNPTQIGNQIGLAQQTRQFLNQAGLGAEVTGNNVFDDIMQQVEHVNVSTPLDGAVVWTGRALGNQTTAMRWAGQTGRSTLEMTPGGQWLESLNLYGSNSPLTRAEADTVWRRLSQRFSSEAQGEVNAFIEGTSFNTKSTFYGTEWPTLYGNPKVPRIIRRR